MDSLLTRELLKANMFDKHEVSGACCPVSVPRSSLVSIPAQSCSISWAPTAPSRAILAIQPTDIQLITQRAVQEMCDRSSCEGAEGTLPPPVAV